MKQSSELNELSAALVAAQTNMPTVDKNADGHGYKYASLDNIMAKVRPVLAEHGLVIIQQPTSQDADGMGLTTRLLHKSGQWLEETVYAPRDEGQRRNAVQAAGSTITYLRRYGIAALLGLVDETDTDGVPDRPKQQAPKRKPAARPVSVEFDALEPARPANGKPLQKASEAQVKRFHALGKEVYGDEWGTKRSKMVEWVTKKRPDGQAVTSSTALYDYEMAELITGMTDKQQEMT